MTAPPAPPAEPTSAPAAAPPRRRRLWVVLAVVAGVGLVVFFAGPYLVSGIVRSKIRSELGERMNARVRMGRVSVGWSGRGELRDLKVVPHGFTEPLIAVKRADLKVSPASALRGRLHGSVAVHDPEVFLEKNPEGKANYDFPEVAERSGARKRERPGKLPDVRFTLDVRNARLRARGVGPGAAPGDETLRAKFDRLEGSVRSGEGAATGRVVLTGFEWIDPRTIVREPQAALTFDLGLSPSRFEVRSFRLEAQAVRGEASGAVALGESSADASTLRGSFQYVPESLGAVLSPWLPVRLEGAGPSKLDFELTGRASGSTLASVLRGARGRLTADLPRMTRPGLTASGRVQMDLDAGTLRGTLPLELNGGRTDFEFAAELREPLRATSGRLKVNVQDVAASAALAPLLEKVSPLFYTVGGEIAGTVLANFDLAWEGVTEGHAESWVAAASQALKGRGRFGVRGFRVAGSPTLDTLAEALELVGRRLDGDLQPVELSIERGRCRYEGMTFATDRFPVRFGGWVGFDRQMDLTVELPVAGRLAQKFPDLSRLLGRSIKVPLRGRVDRPRLDLEGAVSQTLQERGAETLRDEATELLEDFLRGKSVR